MIVYDRSPSLWRLFLIWQGSVMPKIWKRVLFVDLLAVAACMLYRAEHWQFINLTVAPFTIIGLVLGLFVGFRNSVAYERYWEARTLWGSCLITCRSLSRQIIVYAGKSAPEDTRTRVHAVIAFAHALRHRLRGTDPAEDLRRWLPESEVLTTLQSPSPANHILRFLGEQCFRLHREQRLASPVMANIDIQINELSHILGGCERIHTTPIPFAYILLLHRSVYVYCLLLPFGLIDTIGYMTPVVVSFMAYAFLGLDALGDEISNPFTHEANGLALDSICRTIETNLTAELGETPPAALVPQRQILM